MNHPRQSTDPQHTNPPSQPILGWTADRAESNFGFNNAAPTAATPSHKPIADAGEGHLMTIAPTGAGKGRSVIIPTLLSYPGPVIVIDPKGENYQVTARRRREMGQAVYKLDPFEIAGPDSSSLNLLDTFDVDAPDAYDHAMAMAELIAPGRSLPDPFWDESARMLLAALILHVAACRPPVLRNLSEVAYLINQGVEDMQFTVKEMQKSKNDMVRRMAGGFAATEAKVWASILSTAKAATGIFNGHSFGAISGRTDIPLDGIVRGDPISIYLVLPPEKLDSHGRFLRMWIGSLMDQICKRRHQVETPTLFILDEAAQLGPLKQLRRAITLLRGYGVRTWSFWQDLSQLQYLYPDWRTLYNNTRYIQTFGATTHLLAESIAHLLRLPGHIDPLTLSRNQMILAEAGRLPVVAGKPDYLNDPQFKGLYDDNPFYQPIPDPGDEPESNPMPPISDDNTIDFKDLMP
ncbi:MAG: type IV secretory system conjugative DNA transfer family protein [Wenzhouxiangella sp.]